MPTIILYETNSLERYYHHLMECLDQKYGYQDTSEKIPLSDYQIAEMSYYETQVNEMVSHLSQDSSMLVGSI